MAAPADKSTKDLNGVWVLNKTLSQSIDPALALQGVSYVVRTGISYATITITVNQYEAPPKPPNTSTDTFTHIDIEQSASGLSSTLEARCLDEVYRDHTDWLFGHVKGLSKFVSVNELPDEYLKTGWDLKGDNDSKELIMSHVESVDSDWKATQSWGFQIIDGNRMYCRKIMLVKGDEKVTLRSVYDWKGSA